MKLFIFLMFMFLHMMGIDINNYFSLIILILSHLVVAYVSSKIRSNFRNIVNNKFASDFFIF